ncbi:transcriptional regulator [Solibacillus sp. R5-41]|uniref:MurR/RpiR family transcriptional regulator n=1 Tax=Solibacillus sp. R5-41 TaxID=2048654 RepID=UPI000C127212|nr:MurR/RpiR family transcriptional regulator [Solibacillus sp. R5-41]ATP41898.1 transcriptional regulator [Solibacillus sp. R5-41]
MVENGIERIRSGIGLLKPTEKIVADFIVNNTEKIIHMPIAQLSLETKTSEATIIRMCRALHFKGFRDLKLSIAASLGQTKESTAYSELEKNSTIAQMIQTISVHNIQSIQQTLIANDKRELNKVIHQLDHARKIIVIGVGASAVVALDLEHKFKRIDKWCEAIIDSHGQLIAATHVNNKDIIFAISYSGETKEIINAVSEAKKNGATIITMTQNQRNALQTYADSSLFIVSNEAMIRSAATASRIAQLTLIDILFTGVATLKFDRSIEVLDRTRKTIANYSR